MATSKDHVDDDADDDDDEAQISGTLCNQQRLFCGGKM